MLKKTRTTAGILAFLLPVAAAAVPLGAAALPEDRGASGTWQKLLKLQTTASAMHTTAHPDDEHGGVLAWLSRGKGARLALRSCSTAWASSAPKSCSRRTCTTAWTTSTSRR
jgi:hypothetical protein